MFLKVVVFCMCAAYVAAQESVETTTLVAAEEPEFEFVNSTDCEKVDHSDNVQMEVSGCTSEMEVCPLIKGTEPSIAIHFTPTENFTASYYFKVFGIFPKFTVPHGRSKDGCEKSEVFNSTETCQTLGGFFEGVRYIGRSTFVVQAGYPTLSLRVRFLIEERRTKRLVMCQEVAVTLVDPPVTTTENNETE